MEIGMIGLGRMGANIAARLVQGGHRVVGYDPRAESVRSVRSGAGSVPIHWPRSPGNSLRRGRCG